MLLTTCKQQKSKFTKPIQSKMKECLMIPQHKKQLPVIYTMVIPKWIRSSVEYMSCVIEEYLINKSSGFSNCDQST